MRDLNHPKVFGMREGGAFTRGAARNKKIDAGGDLMIHNMPQRGLVERAVLLKWRDERGATTGEHILF